MGISPEPEIDQTVDRQIEQVACKQFCECILAIPIWMIRTHQNIDSSRGAALVQFGPKPCLQFFLRETSVPMVSRINTDDLKALSHE
jgi:hypothetical protein